MYKKEWKQTGQVKTPNKTMTTEKYRSIKNRAHNLGDSTRYDLKVKQFKKETENFKIS